VPPPSGLWEPPLGIPPLSGNFVYLESDFGDFIGLGGRYLYTPLDTHITASASANRVTVSIDGDESWSGNFEGMHFLGRLEVGYYGDLQRYPFHNPVRGGLAWYGEGRACNTLTGWFVVDSVTYDGPALAAIDLRFEQHCEGGGPALHGVIHWAANDTTMPLGPVVPPPADLWEPAPGATPASGNYIYLSSQNGDFVGAGRTYLYTDANAVMSMAAAEGRLSVEVDGTEDWSGAFQAMSGLDQLEVGYYSDLKRFPFHNPARGGLTWSGEGRGCNVLTGWFVVDAVTYDGATLTAIDLRFEQHCEDLDPALRGEIHWGP
jgi:hypothetical protein